MAYIILVIGLALIYFGLKSDSKRSNSNVFSKILERKTDISELENLREEVNYLIVRIEDLENSIISMNEKLNASGQFKPDITASDASHLNVADISDFKGSLQDALKEKSFLNTVTSEKADNNEIRNKIYELFDMGKTVDEISSILRIGKGEVSLRLGLRKLNS